MKSINNTVEEAFDCPSSVLFNLVTAPANWVGLHPVTKAVYGPEIDKSLNVGGVAIEHIVSEEREKPLNAVWLVTEYEKNKMWAFKSLYFGGEPCEVTIRYEFTSLNDKKVIFKRIMITTYADSQLDASEINASKSNASHVEYFANIRKRLDAI